MNNALAFVDVVQRFGAQTALHGVSLQVAAGEIVCLLGPSGCGKTTALRIAAGLERPQQGQVFLADQLVSSADRFVPPEKRQAGLLFQDYALFPHLTIGENVAFGLARLSAAERQQRVARWLERIGLEHKRDSYPHQLSGGEQQRIALARALAPEPAILLLDEPFSNLDTQRRYQVRDEVLHVLKEMGAAALMVTHDPEEALFMGDRIALMDQGRIVQAGAALALYRQPESKLAAAFFGETNCIAVTAAAGLAQTPFGPLPTALVGSVELWVRSEAIQPRLTPRFDGELPQAEVKAVRQLGRTSLLHLRTLPEVTGFNCHLHARVFGNSLLEIGQRLWLDLDMDLAFLFPV